MQRLSLVPLFMITLALAGCPARPPDESKKTAELAEQLVACRNERSALKEQLGGVQEELAKLKETVPAPADKAALRAEGAPVPRAGRSSPRHGDLSGSKPSVRHTGPENPAAEAKAAQEVAQTLRSHINQFRPCYERGLKRNSNLQFVTQVKVRVTATPDGHAKDVHLLPRADADMEACIAQAISRWRFPVYRGQPVVMEVPLNLKVQNP